LWSVVTWPITMMSIVTSTSLAANRATTAALFGW
jgi:hypothetical protein